MSYYRTDYVVTKNENSVLVEVGDKKEWTYFNFELGEDILKNIQSLNQNDSEYLKSDLSGGHKIECFCSEVDGPARVYICFKEKMLGGGYEKEYISIPYSDLFE